VNQLITAKYVELKKSGILEFHISTFPSLAPLAQDLLAHVERVFSEETSPTEHFSE